MPSGSHRWAVAGGVVLVALAVIAALGGSARAAPVRGPHREVGQVIDLARFQVAVQSAALTDVDDSGYEIDPVLQVRLVATSTVEETVGGLPYGLVVAVADGTALPTGYAGRLDGWDSTLDPDLTRPLSYTWDWTATSPPAELQIALYDERLGGNFVDDADEWDVDASHPAAVVTVPVDDRREHR